MKLIRINKQALVFCACLFSLSCKAQQPIDTLLHYLNFDEFSWSIHQDKDSGYDYVAPLIDYSTNTYLNEFSKLNKDGSVAFRKIFGYVGSQCYVGTSGSLKQTSDGGWLVGGSINSSSNKSKGMVVKYNAVGDTEFVKYFGDSVNIFYDCFQTSDSGYIFVGDHAKYIPSFNSNFYIVKTDINGNLEWEHDFGGNNDEQAFHVIENSKNEIVISGITQNANLVYYPYIVIYDLQGNLITTKGINQGALTCTGKVGYFKKYGLSDYTFCGCLDTLININDAPYAQYVARLDSNFNFKWKTIYNSPENTGIFINREVSDGGIVLVGFRHDSIFNAAIGWIAKVDSLGKKLWEHYYKHSLVYNYFVDFQETFDHGFIICGTAWDTTTLNQDSWIVKLDSNGCLDGSCGINTGTQEIFYNSQLAVFPNPVHDLLHINTDENTGEITLFDLMGKEVIQQIADQKKETIIDVSNLVNGMYVIRFTSGKKVFTSKILKE